MWLNLDDISIICLLVRNDLLGDGVSNIHNALIIWPYVIIEKDVLSLIVSLINQKKFGVLSVLTILVPMFPIFLDSHGRSLFESLCEVHELGNRITDDLAVIILFIVIKSILNFIDIISESICDTRN